MQQNTHKQHHLFGLKQKTVFELFIPATLKGIHQWWSEIAPLSFVILGGTENPEQKGKSYRNCVKRSTARERIKDGINWNLVKFHYLDGHINLLWIRADVERTEYIQQQRRLPPSNNVFSWADDFTVVIQWRQVGQPHHRNLAWSLDLRDKTEFK